MTAEEQIAYFLEHPSELLMKKPFTRGADNYPHSSEPAVETGGTVKAELSRRRKMVVSQDQFADELDPNCHKVLFDDNIPSITAKTRDGGYVEIEFKKMSIPFQQMIMNKHVLHLCGYGIQHTFDKTDPSERELEDFHMFKRFWKKRNMDGMRTKMVAAQESYGEAALLFYLDRHKRIKARLFSYENGYVICSHNDDYGDRLIESVYYRSGDQEYIDSWDDTYHYRHSKDMVSKDNPDWVLDLKETHGFTEIPLVTKRGEVGWNNVQTTIEVYEIIYNIFMVIQKRHGWGLLYIKGTFNDTAKKIAGAVVLNDSSLNKDGDAKYLTPPSPDGMLETLKTLEETIQKGAGCTFILPKDVTTGGDISGVAIQITQSLDNERALQGVIEWQNVVDKMTRLFKEGLAMELVKSNDDSTAVTRYKGYEYHGESKVWRPRNDAEYNQMLGTMKSQGLLSQKTGIEKNTEATPDEVARVNKEIEEQRAYEAEQAKQQAALKSKQSSKEE